MKPSEFVKLWSVWAAALSAFVLALEPHLPALQGALAPFPEWKALLPVLFLVARYLPQAASKKSVAPAVAESAEEAAERYRARLAAYPGDSPPGSAKLKLED